MNKRTVPLNIVISYPVYWNRYRIFRDYIQNFYDSVDMHDWKEEFHYSYKDSKLSMWVENVTFSYEWLLHIGASTKTGATGRKSAGYFGEGFKIASLCALRDYDWDICMSSGDWSMSVVKINQKVDGTEVEMLAYDIETRTSVDESRLELYPISQKEYEEFLAVINSFLYDGNPLLGEKIWEGRQGAAYICNTERYNDKLPCTSEYGRKGMVFCDYQLLGSNPFGLCICQHNYNQKDRERSMLYKFEVIQVFGEVCAYISPEGAMKVLEKMRRCWSMMPKGKIDISSWAPVIHTLVVRIALSDSVTRMFREKYPNLIYLTPTFTASDKNRRREAYAWLRRQEKDYRVVQVSFERLGYHSLEKECEDNNGFVLDDNPNDMESICMDIIEEAIAEIYGRFFTVEKFPERKIITNDTAIYHGMAYVIKNRKRMENEYGLRIKNNVRQIYLKRMVFRKDGFYDALSTYIHEYCHSFGGDSSQSFSLALTIAIEILMENHDALQKYKIKWEKIFDDRFHNVHKPCRKC